MTNHDYEMDKQEEFELDCERYCVLGKKILLATALFESGLALIIHAEGEALDTINDALDPCDKANLNDLVKYNETTRDLICCIADIKKEIVHELEIGKAIANSHMDPCPCNPNKPC